MKIIPIILSTLDIEAIILHLSPQILLPLPPLYLYSLLNHIIIFISANISCIPIALPHPNNRPLHFILLEFLTISIFTLTFLIALIFVIILNNIIFLLLSTNH